MSISSSATAFQIRFGATVKVDRVQALLRDLLNLSKKQVLVGVPESTNPRKEGTMGNATLAFIHDNGSPLANIPARPFMKPGIRNCQENVNKELFAVAQAYLDKDGVTVDRRLHRAGMIAQNSIRKVINEGEGFSPLKRGTQLARLRKRKAAKKWTKEKREESMESMRPLVDTGQLRSSITYVVEEKS